MKIIAVNDTFPCDKKMSSVFCKVITSENQSEFWPILLEKAYAKLYSCYEALAWGLPEHGLVDISNGLAENIRLDDNMFRQRNKDGQFWGTLTKLIEQRHLLAALSNEEFFDQNSERVRPRKVGIVATHAYSVLDAVVLDGTKLLLLRNPWGKTEWKGDWSDYDSKRWTESNKRFIEERQREFGKERFEIGKTDDGTFWMAYEDFIRYFSSLSIVRIYEQPEWKK